MGVWLSQLESQLTQASPEEYATMSDDLVMVHAAVQLWHKLGSILQDSKQGNKSTDAVGGLDGCIRFGNCQAHFCVVCAWQPRPFACL
jgi:hypothetical protein